MLITISITEEFIAGCDENYYIQGRHKLHLEEPLVLLSQLNADKQTAVCTQLWGEGGPWATLFYEWSHKKEVRKGQELTRLQLRGMHKSGITTLEGKLARKPWEMQEQKMLLISKEGFSETATV